jgi:hypothetical protein
MLDPNLPMTQSTRYKGTPHGNKGLQHTPEKALQLPSWLQDLCARCEMLASRKFWGHP